MNLPPKLVDWGWRNEDEESLAHWIVVASWWNLDDRKYLSWTETRKMLKSIGDNGRRKALWTLTEILADYDNWISFTKRFLKQAWPKELQFRTSPTSYNLIGVAERAGPHFPDVVKTILPLIMPVERADTFVFKMNKDKDDDSSSLAAQHPKEVLALLDKMISHQEQFPPYGLATVLDLISDSQSELKLDQKWIRLSRLAGRV